MEEKLLIALVSIPSNKTELKIASYLSALFKNEFPDFKERRILFEKDRYNLLFTNSKKVKVRL